MPRVATVVRYDDVVAAIEPTGMIARGGFEVGSEDRIAPLDDGRAVRTVVVVGNIGGSIWPHFRAGEQPVDDPLDEWTRRVLRPVAERYGAGYVHPSDEPYIPMQRWAQRADDVFPSPIGLLIHPEHGLWHAYRGAFLFAEPVEGLPPVGGRPSPCTTCDGQPCRTTCPVDAFSTADGGLVGYDHVRCRSHVVPGDEPVCLTGGCAARRACPVNAEGFYDVDQMTFHMRAFVGGDV